MEFSLLTSGSVKLTSQIDYIVLVIPQLILHKQLALTHLTSGHFTV